VERAIKPDDAHFARTRLLALENTINGKVLGLDYHGEAVAFCRHHKLALHLDGARIFNASVKLGIPVNELCWGFDSVSVCLSKGLGAPAGSVLVGPKPFIAEAKRARKMLGGAMRQAGILAAACLYALDNHIDRLAEDHANADRLARGLRQIPQLVVEPVQTNMVFVQIPADQMTAFKAHLSSHRVQAIVSPRMRLVTHLDVGAAQIAEVVNAFEAFFAKMPRRVVTS